MLDGNCSIRILNILDGIMPDFHCVPKHTTAKIEVDVTYPVPNEIMIPYLLMIFAAGIFGATILELVLNKLEWYISPLVTRIQKRYNFITERNRLETMNGHP